VKIGGGFRSDLPVLLLDEPTASLDAGNRAVVVDLVAEKKWRGTAVVAIVHDDDERAAIADTVIDVNRFTAAARGCPWRTADCSPPMLPWALPTPPSRPGGSPPPTR